ncbi:MULTISPECIES: DUF4349 domain-containing protein [Streptomyces]|uniref:DUF4349 domain-containing protein n=2 Tax=Streptomyces TaxID=1883 RepID=A0ABU4K9T0_9ACTN|nr:DUF4349 domain-containing protein [Streptomyces roseolus]MDX2294503.1 DUF4349 domain-containing protein [Streptomyces roseolus]
MHVSDRTKRSSRRGRAGAALLLAASLALTAGCGADSADGGNDGKAAAAQGKLDHKGAADGTTGGSSGAEADAKPGATKPGGTRAPTVQHLIRTASLSVEVERVAETAGRVRAVATAAGGRVESESTERVDERYDHSTLVLRVPQDRYDQVLADLAGTGKLLSREAKAQDVTDQVVDVESRIATRRASVARVRTLMDRAERLADVVTLEGELSRRQADLEALLAQRASLKDRTSLATITVSLSQQERPAAGDEVTDDSRPAFGDALSGGWNALVAVVAWTLVVLAALAPWLAVALAAYAVWRWGVRPRRRARAAVAAPRPEPVPAAVPGQGARTNAAGLPLPEEEPAGAPDEEGSAP